MGKYRSDSTPSKLDSIQLEMLFDWILETSLDQARERAASAAPYGFNLQIHKTTLARFFREEKKRRHAQQLAELAAADQTDSVLSPLSSKLVADLIAAARAEHAHAIYELSLAADDPKNFDRLERALHNIDMAEVKKAQVKIQEQNFVLARERLAFEKLKFEFDATREALNHAVQYVDTLTNPTMDDQDKVWKARTICFGPMPENVLSPAFHANLKSRPGQAAGPDKVVHAGTQSPNGPTPLTQLAPVQNPEVATAAPPELSPESSDLSPTPSAPPSVLGTEAPAPDTLKHNSSNGGTISGGATSGGASSASPAIPDTVVYTSLFAEANNVTGQPTRGVLGKPIAQSAEPTASYNEVSAPSGDTQSSVL